MTVQTYDPKEVSVTLNNQLITGFAEDMITAERDNDQTDDMSGAQGDVQRVLTHDKRGLITLTLLPGSPSNLILSNLVNSDGVDGNQSIFPILIKDNRGDDKVQGENAWVRKPPRAVFNKGIEGREWEIRVANLEMVIGGIPETA
jgi:hypothetical protein